MDASSEKGGTYWEIVLAIGVFSAACLAAFVMLIVLYPGEASWRFLETREAAPAAHEPTAVEVIGSLSAPSEQGAITAQEEAEALSSLSAPANHPAMTAAERAQALDSLTAK